MSLSLANQFLLQCTFIMIVLESAGLFCFCYGIVNAVNPYRSDGMIYRFSKCYSSLFCFSLQKFRKSYFLKS